jgi:hypothetical protein
MAVDKYIIRPVNNQADTVANLGIGQSSLVTDGAETTNKHVHRIGNTIFVTANCREYDVATMTFSLSDESFKSIKIGAAETAWWSVDGDGVGHLKPLIPDSADPIVDGELYYDASGYVRIKL